MLGWLFAALFLAAHLGPDAAEPRWATGRAVPESGIGL
jgi:hypothetical protein